MRKMKLKMAITLITVSFIIIAISTPLAAAHPKRILFLAMGDDIDINATDLIIGKIDFGKDDELPSVNAVFHQRIYDDSGKKVYTMMGMFKGELLTTNYYFLCPVFNVWFINVWWFMGEGTFKTTDTKLDLTYRKWFSITMPNTEGKYVKAPMLMFLSPTAEYCLQDPGTYTPGSPENPVYILPEGAWVLVGVLCGIIVVTPMGPVELPIGPASCLTISFGM